jgi:hypothetical protein
MVRYICPVLTIVLLTFLLACKGVDEWQPAVSYETMQSFRPARGSIAMGFNGSDLKQATKISEVRSKCGTPEAEWEEDIPFFTKVKRLKYRTRDVHNNVLLATMTFVAARSDPPLIGIDYEPFSEGSRGSRK